MFLGGLEINLRLVRRKTGGARVRLATSEPLVEGVSVGTLIGTLEVRGAPAGVSYDFTLAANPTGLVRLDGDQLLTDGTIVAADNPSIAATIQATPRAPSVAETLIENLFIPVAAVAGPTLNALSLSAATIAEDAAQGTVVGAIEGATAGSSIEMTVTAQGRFALVGNEVVRGSGAFNLAVGESANIVLRETLTGYAARSTSIAITATAADPVTSVLALSTTPGTVTATFTRPPAPVVSTTPGTVTVTFSNPA